MSKHRRPPKILIGIQLDIVMPFPFCIGWEHLEQEILKEKAPHIAALYNVHHYHLFLAGDDAEKHCYGKYKTISCRTKFAMHRHIRTLVDEIGVLGEEYDIRGRISVYFPREIERRLESLKKFDKP
jgi:hypothetical protein